LIAVDIPATQSTVTSGAMSGDSDQKPRNGSRKNSIVTPRSDSALPASTWPASLAGGDTSRMSSTRPTRKMIVAPRRMPSGSDVPRKTGSNWSTWVATAIPARNPRYIDRPPSTGVGRAWTRRSSGAWTTLARIASRRTSGVVATVTPVATSRTTR
jgi:hypothetical protein